jgi:capsular polysaccharide transport system permease protein
MPVSDRMGEKTDDQYSKRQKADSLASLPEREEDASRWATVLPPLPRRSSSSSQAGAAAFAKFSLQVLPAPLTPPTERNESAVSNSTERRFSPDEAQASPDRNESAETNVDSTAAEFRSPTSPEVGRADTAPDRIVASMPPLPQLRAKRISPLFVSFLICVVAPLAAVGIYLFAFASDQYVAEFRFSVTESNPVSGGSSMAAPQSAANAMISSTASALLGGTSVTSASPQNYVVVDYLKSRQALDDIQRRINLRAMFSKSDIDWWQRFEQGGIEKFADYWSGVVSANYDPVTGLAIAKVKAFTPSDALLIAQTLVTLSEDLVNSIAGRTQADAVKFAEGEVARAENKLKDVRQQVLEFRTNEGVIDPNLSVVPANIELVKQLRANLVQAQTDLATLRGQKLQSGATASQALVSRIAATKDELAKVEREVAKDRDGARALAEIMAKFEKLDLDRQYAQSMLINALQAYDQARAYAAAQHLYLTPYVRPSLPETATYPRRLLTMLLAAGSLFGVWLSGLVIYRSIRDHAL